MISRSLIGLALLLSPLHADVLSWRNGNTGDYSDHHISKPWNEENTIWRITTPSRGNACPILVGDKLIYTAEPCEIICADARSGKTLWTRSNAYEDVANLSPEQLQIIEEAKIGLKDAEAELKPLKLSEYKLKRKLKKAPDDTEAKQSLKKIKKQIAAIEHRVASPLEKYKKPGTHSTNGYASYTPCSDGQYIYTCNGLGIVTKHDLDGNRLWANVLTPPDHGWGGAVSPIIVNNKLIVRFAEYTALNLQDGSILWQTTPSQTVFAPPATFKLENEHFLYTARGELISVRDGSKLPSQDWVNSDMKVAFFNTSYVLDNKIYCVNGSQGMKGDAHCMQIPDTIDKLKQYGLSETWRTEVKKDRYYACPIVHDGIMYIFSMDQSFQTLDAQNGEIIYETKIDGIPGRTFPGLLMLDNMIYLGEENGTALLVEPGREFKEILRFNVGECRSTPIFSNGIAYLRTLEELMAVKLN